MKIVRFISACTPAEGAYGIVDEDAGTVEMASGDVFSALTGTGEVCPLEAIEKYLPPVDPPNVIAIGANYADHCKESDAELPPLPLVFIKATTSVIGHKDEIVLPIHHPDEIDYEAELAVYIGKTARNVSKADAYDYVLGYSCAHDVSARDVQKRIDTQWARAKSFDTFCPIGPWLVTDINPEGLHVRMRINGEELQDQPTTDMLFDIPTIIEHLTAGMTLLPGTVILTGTPSGVGMARDPQRFLRPGDLCEVDVEEIGVLENPVVAS